MFEIDIRFVQKNDGLVYYIASLNFAGRVPLRGLSANPLYALGELVSLLFSVVAEYERQGYLAETEPPLVQPETEVKGDAPTLKPDPVLH